MPSDIGREQFFKYQSWGVKPDTPDIYFDILMSGRKVMDFLCSEYEQMYDRGDWWGLYQVWIDWKGNRWLLPHLLKWRKTKTGLELPKWLIID